jgi:hypothetical protein
MMMWGAALSVLLPLAGGGEPVQSAVEYPSAVLDNGEVRLVVDIPDTENGRYRGIRFDWSGQILSARYRGHEVFGPWKKHPADAGLFADGAGPSEEFSMYDPLGYAEAAPGETFVKIGVGVLRRRDAEDYLFHAPYPVVQLGGWESRRGDLWVESRQRMATEDGWGYDYAKRVELHPHFAVLTITRTLHNTGSRTIDTDHYSHNFFTTGERIPGAEVELQTAFNVPPTTVNDSVHFDGFRIFFTEPLKTGGHYANLVEMTGAEGALPAGFNFGRWRDKERGIELQFHGSHPVHRYVFYGVYNSLSLEPFVKVVLEPGERMQWCTVYRFAALE